MCEFFNKIIFVLMKHSLCIESILNEINFHIIFTFSQDVEDLISGTSNGGEENSKEEDSVVEICAQEEEERESCS